MRRWIAFVCCVVLLCCLFTGCSTPAEDLSADSGAEHNDSVTVAEEMTLAFNREDTLDPFSAETQLNLQLAALLYDDLVTPDDTFSATSRIATVKQTDSTHVTAKVKSGIKFSDGTALTAADIVYSFELARKSPHYKVRLSAFASAVANGKTVTFTLRTADKYAAANLCFPVIKRDTATDKAATAPIGSGTYLYQADTQSLTINTHAVNADTAPIRKITLRHLVNAASVLQALENGSIHYMFSDLSDGNIPRTSLHDVAVDLPRLVYIGVNGGRVLTDTAAYRRALSSALDRTAIAAAAYTGRAQAATSPFHPNWKPASGLTCIGAGSDTAAALSLAKQALASTTAKTTDGTQATVSSTTTTTTTTAANAQTTSGSKTTALTKRELVMIYPTGNSCREAAVKMIVSQFSAAGITVKATPLAYKTYLKRLKAGDFDLYIGEIVLTPNMDLSVFLQNGGNAAYGIHAADLSAKYTAFKEGTDSAASFVVAFGEEMPYIPLCWLQGMVAHANDLPEISPTAYNLFEGLI